MRVEADAGIGELGHVGAADDDHALVLQPRDGSGIGGGRRGIAQHPGACGRHLARQVEDVLRGKGNAGERRNLAAALPLLVDEVRRGARALGIDRDEGPRPLARRIGDQRQGALDQVTGGEFALSQVAGEFSECGHGSILQSCNWA